MRDRQPTGERTFWRARLRESEDFASTLVGMDVQSATALVRQRGYAAEVITSGRTFDQRLDRIRLFADRHDIVARAYVG